MGTCSMCKEWEYKSEYIAIIPENQGLNTPIGGRFSSRLYWQELLEKELEKHGASGWELVSISEQLAQGAAMDGFALFKRPKEG